MQACERDIEKLCGLPFSRLDSVQGFDGKVVRCLQDFRDELMVCSIMCTGLKVGS